VAPVSEDGAGWNRAVVLDVACPSQLACYALNSGAQGGVWVTSGGGVTWTRHKLPGKSAEPVYEAIDFRTELTGWAIGSSGKIAKATDGGVTWVAQVSGARG